MAVITLSRQIGSGGEEVAARICDLLGYRYFDKQLLVEVAAETGLMERDVIDFSEERYEVRTFFSRLFRAVPNLVARVPPVHEDAAHETITLKELDEEACVELIRHAVRAAHRLDNVVVVGRGGQAILQDEPSVLHVRIVAPDEDRMRRLRERGMSGVAEIKLKLRQQDRASADYLWRFYKVRWDDPALYHLILNTGKLDVERAAQLVVALVRQQQAAPAVSG